MGVVAGERKRRQKKRREEKRREENRTEQNRTEENQTRKDRAVDPKGNTDLQRSTHYATFTSQSNTVHLMDIPGHLLCQ